MKKQYFILFILLLIVLAQMKGCIKKDGMNTSETIAEDTLVSEETDSPVTPEEDTKEETDSQPVEEEAAKNRETQYPSWWELYDYNLDQEDLAADGELKNLSIQPGDTADSINLTWFSKSSSRGQVTFIANDGSNTLMAQADTQPSTAVPGYYRNRATIQGLESNTRYWYTVSNGSTSSSGYQYKTNDLYSTDFTFTIAGDCEIGLGDEEVWMEHRSMWRVVLNRMRSQIPNSSFLISMGDQVADPSSSVNYDYFLDNSILYSTPLVPLVGNHDSGTGFFGEHFTVPNISSYGAESGRDEDYWFVRGDVLFMVLNTSCPLPDDIHEDFIAETIAANPDAKWRIILSHYSPVTVVERYQGVRKALHELYPEWGATYDIDLFIGGHDHIYTRSYFLDEDSDPLEGQTLQYEFHNPEHPLYIIVSGSTNALLREVTVDYPWSAVSVQNGVPQLTEVHVTKNSLNVVTHDADTWAIVDNFTIYKD